MKSQNYYSDEMVNAYVDGELDEEECALIINDERYDEVLSARICECRMLKEKVKHAYDDVGQPGYSAGSMNCPAMVTPAFVNRYKALVAGVLVIIALSLGWLSMDNNNSHLVVAKGLMKTSPPLVASSLASAVVNQDKLVIHVSQYQPERFGDILDQVELLLQQQESNRAIQVEIVANEQGLESLDTDSSAHASRIHALSQRYQSFDVVACAKSLADLATAGNPIQLMKSIVITPAAGKQIAKRLSQGWFYIKV